jgi:hypothetical protein
MHKSTSNSEREHMGERKTDGGAPHQPEHMPEHMPGDSNDILQGTQHRDQADGHVESHGPALFA